MDPLQPFDLLADDLAQLVFSRCDQDCRTQVLPLVCRRFAQLLRGPSACWRKLRFRQFTPDHSPAVEARRQAQLRCFLGWALPRAHGVANLYLRSYLVAEGPVLAALTHLLNQCTALQVAELWLSEEMVQAVLPPAVEFPQLVSLLLMSDPFLPEALNLACLTKLQAATLLSGLPMPEAALSNPESLPPSLTALALNPVPVRPDGTGAIPPQILHMPFLQRLELLEGEGLHGLEESLQQLTQLTYLSLTDTHLDHLPPSMSALCNLRQLHLFNPNHAQAQEPDLSFLSVLARLQMLDVSLHSGMQQAPPQLAQLTNLVVLHLEETPLEALPGSLSSLVHLQVLGIDWRPMMASHAVLPTLPCLWRLVLGRTNLSAEQAAARAAQTDAMLSSLQRCGALTSVLVCVAEDLRLSMPVALMMAQLPRLCLQVTVDATAIEETKIGGMPEEELEALLASCCSK